VDCAVNTAIISKRSSTGFDEKNKTKTKTKTKNAFK
jgi:hypothetical protein